MRVFLSGGLKTEVVGGPSYSRELEQHVHYAFLSVAVVVLLALEMSHVL